MWQSQVESEHYSYQILTAFSDSALYNSRLKEAMALQFVCVLYGIPALPVGEHVLSFFVAYLYREGLAPSSVKSYLSFARCLGSTY